MKGMVAGKHVEREFGNQEQEHTKRLSFFLVLLLLLSELIRVVCKLSIHHS